jgi:hypothetical protein
MTGKANARVLPDPVSASAIISLPIIFYNYKIPAKVYGILST